MKSEFEKFDKEKKGYLNKKDFEKYMKEVTKYWIELTKKQQEPIYDEENFHLKLLEMSLEKLEEEKLKYFENQAKLNLIEELKTDFLSYDHDEDGKISYEDFTNYILSSENKYISIFRKYRDDIPINIQ
jgi:Ca2+-binding EF-hand superfamily protein